MFVEIFQEAAVLADQIARCCAASAGSFDPSLVAVAAEK
jgi:hypothetical protein